MHLNATRKNIFKITSQWLLSEMSKHKGIVYSVLTLQALLQLVCMPESFHEHTCKQTTIVLPKMKKVIFWMLLCPIGLSNSIQTEGPGSLSREEQTLEAVLAPLPWSQECYIMLHISSGVSPHSPGCLGLLTLSGQCHTWPVGGMWPVAVTDKQSVLCSLFHYRYGWGGQTEVSSWRVTFHTTQWHKSVFQESHRLHGSYIMVTA